MTTITSPKEPLQIAAIEAVTGLFCYHGGDGQIIITPTPTEEAEAKDSLEGDDEDWTWKHIPSSGDVFDGMPPEDNPDGEVVGA
jgi:hypothetical protein